MEFLASKVVGPADSGVANLVRVADLDPAARNRPFAYPESPLINLELSRLDGDGERLAAVEGLTDLTAQVASTVTPPPAMFWIVGTSMSD